MLNRLNKFFNDFYLFMAEFRALKERIDGSTETALMRKLLGSIDPSVRSGEPKDGARKEFVKRMETIYADVLPVLEAMVNDQCQEAGHGEGDISFMRGSVNGIELVREKFEGWHGEFNDRRPKPPGTSIGGVIPALNLSPFPGNTAGNEEKVE